MGSGAIVIMSSMFPWGCSGVGGWFLVDGLVDRLVGSTAGGRWLAVQPQFGQHPCNDFGLFCKHNY